VCSRFTEHNDRVHIAVFLSFAECVFGVFYASFSTPYVILLKYPDYFVAKHGHLSTSVMYPLGGYFKCIFPLVFLIIVVALLLGIGTRSRYRRARKIDRREMLEKEEYRKGDSFIMWKTLLESHCGEIMDEDVIAKLLNQITIERINYSDRKELTDDHLKSLGVLRLGYRMAILKTCRDFT
jgi:hypothetical protein